jgi:copper chaperone CopZ
MRQVSWICAVVAAAALLLAVIGTVRSGDGPPGPLTKITVEGMHCPGCAKKVANRLKQLSGVADIQIDVEAGVVNVTPASGSSPSPRALWEAVEQARYKPIRLDGPSGTFTTKPKN